ncbi:hypothetical protein T492DRAFT_1114131 [Pavlovales sp. CCMP2436]|nr:hypothetical protein T492DRAFT_1114131 [Pavlovales sp. CCMP2436]
MVKGHPTIAVEMAKTCGMTPLIGVQYYIDYFDTIVKETSEYYSADEDNILDDGDVKMLFNAIIYGGGFTTWKKALSDPKKVEKTKKLRNTTMRLDFITNFKNDIVRFNNEVYKKNKSLIAKVTKNSKTPYEKKGTTASYWFQIIENHILHNVAVLLLKKGVMLPYRYRLEYDEMIAKFISLDISPIEENTDEQFDRGIIPTIKSSKKADTKTLLLNVGEFYMLNIEIFGEVLQEKMKRKN